MLKSQDCIILLKLLANQERQFTQRQLAQSLSMSLSEVNAGIKRLHTSGLLRSGQEGEELPVISAAEAFLINGIKYMLPAKLGEYTRGTPTAYAAPLFADKIALGDDPIPVWPDAMGKEKGVALPPLHPTVVNALHNSPDQRLYELLVLVDALRIGNARERKLAETMLKSRLHDGK